MRSVGAVADHHDGPAAPERGPDGAPRDADPHGQHEADGAPDQHPVELLAALGPVPRDPRLGSPEARGPDDIDDLWPVDFF